MQELGNVLNGNRVSGVDLPHQEEIEVEAVPVDPVSGNTGQPARPQGGPLVAQIRRAIQSEQRFEIPLDELICRVQKGVDGSVDLDQESMSLAKMTVLNAASRVCSNKWQWISEFLRNAHDACQPPEDVVGEHGLGFYAVFDALGEEGTLEILTWVQNEACRGYRVRIQGLVASFEALTEKDAALRPKTGHGTVMLVSNVSFDPNELKPYLHAFDERPEMESGLVYAMSYPDKRSVCVGDGGTGITIRDMVECTLVPSSSGKPLRDAPRIPRSCNVKTGVWKGKVNTDKSLLIISINGGVCMTETLPHALPLEIEGKPADLFIDMPSGTRQPTSRDAILIDKDEQDFETQCLFMTLRKVLRDCMDLGGDLRLFTLLFRALAGWETVTACSHMCARFSRHALQIFRQMYGQRPKLIAVRARDFDGLTRVFAGTDLQVMAVDPVLVDSSYARLQAAVRQLARDNPGEHASELELQASRGSLIRDVRLIFLPDQCLPQTRQGRAEICSFGVRNALFVPRSMLSEARGNRQALQEALVLRYAEDGMPRLEAVEQVLEGSPSTAILLRQEEASRRQVSSVSLPRGYQPGLMDPLNLLQGFDEALLITYIDALRERRDAINTLWNRYKGSQEGWTFQRDFFAGADAERIQRLKALVFGLACSWQLLPTSLIQQQLHGQLRGLQAADDGQGQLYYGDERIWPFPEQPDAKDLSRFLAVCMMRDKNAGLLRFFAGKEIGRFAGQRQQTLLELERGSSQDIAKLRARIRDLQWLRMCNAAYARCVATPVERIAIETVITQQVLQLSLAQLQLGRDVSARVDVFLDSLSSIYAEYLRLPAEGLAYHYETGELTISVIREKRHLDDWSDAGAVLRRLAELSACRLLDLSLDFLAQRCGAKRPDGSASTEKRIQAGVLTLPTLLGTNPLGLAARLMFRHGLAASVLNLMLEEARDTRDFVLMAVLFGSYHQREQASFFGKSIFSSVDVETEGWRADLRFFIQEFLKERLSETSLSSWYQSINKATRVEDLEAAMHKDALLQTFSDYAKQMSEPPSEVHQLNHFINAELRQAFNQAEPFSMDQLRQAFYCQTNELLRALQGDSMAAAVALTAKQEEVLESRQVRQNVGYATVAGVLQAVYGELIQNSADEAVRFGGRALAAGRQGAWADISVEVGIVAGSQLSLVVDDQIGFPDRKTLLVDLNIPGYSRKEGLVGQMGNGFAKIFAGAESVLITTSILGKDEAYAIHYTPRRFEGVVHDVGMRIVRIAKVREGTRIAILFPRQDPAQVRMDARQALHFFEETLTAAQMPLACTHPKTCIAIKLRGPGASRLLNEPDPAKRPLLLAAPGEIPMQLRRLQSGHKASYVTAGGLPHAPLASYKVLRAYLPPEMTRVLDRGLALTLDTRSYQPVQNRTDMRLLPGEAERCARLLHDAYWLLTLHQESRNKVALFQWGTSHGELTQVQVQASHASFQMAVSAAGKGYWSSELWMLQHEPQALQSCCWKSVAEIISAQLEHPLMKAIIEGDKAHERSLAALIDQAHDDLTLNPQLVRASRWMKQIRQLSSLRHSQVEQEFAQWEQELLANVADRFDAGRSSSEQIQVLEDLLRHVVSPWFRNKIHAGSRNFKKNDELRERYPFFGRSALEEAGRRLEAIGNGLTIAGGVIAMPFVLAAVAGGKVWDALKRRLPQREQQQRMIEHIETQAVELSGQMQRLHRLVTFSLESYFACVFAGIGQSGSAPFVQLCATHATHTASYDNVAHAIRLQLRSWRLAPLLKLLLALVKEDQAEVLRRCESLFVPTLTSSGALNHELEHARCRDNCEGGCHDARQAADGRMLNFNAAATNLYQVAARNGHMQQWLAGMREMLREEFEGSEDALAELHAATLLWEGPQAELFLAAFTQISAQERSLDVEEMN